MIEKIGTKPFERMRIGQMIKYPSQRAGTVQANLTKVKLKYRDRNYVTKTTDTYIYVIRDT